MANEKQHAHQLIEQLPAHQLSAVVGLLEAMLDPVARKLAAAPIDDEPETEEDAGKSSRRKSGCASAAAKAFLTRKCSKTSV